MWLRGQSWLASAELPTEIEHQLIINFYDKHGAVELARYDQTFRVDPNNASVYFRIHSSEFDADQFDSDGDGVSNLAELNIGLDPFVDEGLALELSNTFSLSGNGPYSRRSTSQYFESHIKQDRPYVDSYETKRVIPEERGPTPIFGKFSIAIDADGNGTFDIGDTDESTRYYATSANATRISTGDSVSWMGKLSTSNIEYVHSETVDSTVSVVSDNLRRFVQEFYGRNSGVFRFEWESSANLIGELIEGTSLCKPVAGTFTEVRWTDYGRSSSDLVTTTVSKEIDDPYWRVLTVDDELGTTEYYARDLEISHDPDDKDSAFFTCVFVDF